MSVFISNAPDTTMSFSAPEGISTQPVSVCNLAQPAFQTFVNPQKKFLLEARAKLRRQIPIFTDERWDFPYFKAYYRVQGPLQVKSVKSRIKLKLFIFVMRLDEGEEYKYSSPFECSGRIEKIQTLPNPFDKIKRSLITLRLESINESNFYTYNLKEFRDLPNSQALCLHPNIDDICQIIYTPGDPSLEYQGIITHWLSNNYVFPSYTPPADHFGNYLRIADREDYQLSFAVDQTEWYDQKFKVFACRIVPQIYSLKGELKASFPEHSFYLRINVLSPQPYAMHYDPTECDTGRLIGQIASAAPDFQIAKTFDLFYGLPTLPDLLPAGEISYQQIFARDGLIRITYDRIKNCSFIEHILGPQTPEIGLFPFSPIH